MKVKNPVSDWNSEQLIATRRKLNNELRERNIWANTPYPADCWIFDEVLGIDPRTVVSDACITKKGYVAFVLNEEGARGLNPVTRKFTRVNREFDAQQRQALREWWDLLSPEIRGE